MEPISKQKAFTFLKGGGEMGARMRAFPWEESDLAGPGNWIQSLRTTLSILLHARLPMILFWGEEHRCFFNDAFLHAPGLSTGIDALAQPAANCFPRLWAHIGTQVRQVLNGAEAAPVEDVRLSDTAGKNLHEPYWSFSISPVITQNNDVGGVLCICEDVTAKVQAMAGLRISNERFQKLLRDASTGIAILNAEDAVVSFANDAYALLIGRRSTQIINRSMYELVPGSEETLGKIIGSVLRSGKTLRLYAQPFKATDDDGKEVSGFVNAVYQPYVEPDGGISGVIVLCHEVTEQEESHRQLAESEHRLRSLVEATPVRMMLLTGPDLTIALANAPVLRAWQKDESILGKPLLDVVPELREQKFPEILRRVYESGEAYIASAIPAEYFNGGDELKTYYYNLSYQPMRDASGRIYGVLSTAVDVTEKVRALRASEESARDLRTAVELAELATWSLDVKRGTINFSPRFMEWLGFSKSTQSLRDAYHQLPREYRHPVARDIIKALQKGSPGTYDREHPMLNQRTGREYIIHMLAEVERDAKGMPVVLRGMAQDVTEQRALQRRLEQQVAERTSELADANAQLHRSNEELTQYAYVASHDLQEPLRKIRVFAGMLGRQPDLGPESRELVEKTEEAAARMTQLIKDLLEFSKLLNAEPLRRPVDLNVLCRAVIADFDLSIRERGAEIHIGPLPQVLAVALQMNQLFYNLIGNALKFTEPGRPPKIRIEARRVSTDELASLMPGVQPQWEYFDVTVRDNGIGFDTRYSEQIFEVFKRLHGRNVYPGSGIGLALCRRIAANAKGFLYAESEPGNGATFHVILPDRRDEQGLNEIGPERFQWTGFDLRDAEF
jgi:PAS domain S-box-containing protein